MITPSTVKIVADVAGFNRDMSTAEKKMQSFGGVVGGLKTAAVSLGAAMLASAGVNGLSAMVARSMQLRDANAKLADRLGITTQKVAAFTLQSELSGIGMDGMERALQKMTVRLQDAAEQGGPVADAIKKIGLNVYELASKKPDEAFFMISDAMKNMTNANEKLNSVSDIFGDKSLAITNMLNEGRAGFDLAAQKATEFGTAISRVDAAKLEAANDSFTLMQESVDGLATRIGIRLSPMLQQMAENFASNTTAMAKMLGFRTEEEELNHLLASRAGLLKQIADIEAAAGGKVQGTAALSARADALRAEINLILNKQRTETEAFVASDKMRIVEEQATAKRLENSALETTAIKNKKVAIDAELQAMRDREAYRKELQTEMQAELAFEAEGKRIFYDAEIEALKLQSAAEEDAAVQHNALVDQQLQLDQTAADSKRAMQASVIGNALSLMQMLGGKSKTWAKAAVVLDKAMSIAKIAMATEVASMNAAAAAAVGGPGAVAAAVASMRAMGALSMGIVAGMGALELSNINTGGGSSASGAGTGGAAGLSPYGAPPVVMPMQQEQRQGSISVYINGPTNEQFMVDTVVPMLQDMVQHRDVIIVRNDSRNGQMLMDK